MNSKSDGGGGGCVFLFLWLVFLFVVLPITLVRYERRMRAIETKLNIEAPAGKKELLSGMAELWGDLREAYQEKGVERDH